MKVKFIYRHAFNSEYIMLNCTEITFGKFILTCVVTGFKKPLTYSMKRISELSVID